ncbi:MAG: glutamate racemase [Deltaproteobacteria bacterium]|nr:glutamate racemase [Deltaproteobacteria bacterium]MBW2339845.1 glutamate racemase [Deltaproteobacteria bacterium]
MLMKLNPTNSIGVFDSGIGGLTVVRAVIEQLPSENIIYFGDTARVPYGVKSPETISRYATQITEFLLQQKVKLLIVACNTMAAVAYEAIKDLSPVPVLGVVDAGARSAVAETHNKYVGVIGTPATINSNAYQKAIKGLDSDIRVISQPCPLFVPLVEEGWLDHQVTRITAQEYLKPVVAQNIDTLVLGCTHYPLLKPLLREILGNQITLVDSAQTIAKETEELLRRNGLQSIQGISPEYRFYVTDVPLRFKEIGERFLGRTLSNITVVKW